MKNSFKIIFLSGLFVFQSCATIVSGSRQTIKFNSVPASATVFINEVEIGKTPVEKNLKRNQEYEVLIKLDGYKTYKTTLSKKFNEWYVGNILFGGIIGLVVDPITGAIYKLSPNELTTRLENETTDVVFKDKGDDVHISVSLNIDPEWEKIGQLEKTE
ncbi:PEGA domain-containing protein [Christiangramia gaetbulicola]|uniref:PEGA domain-containing protein n=1 Tax=Christiangramia gaetbulicola TaxID=703340 RepID=A0A2T6AN76_9FLAO|nr:PEGA domain-containing protein [Christiangramia gaetbulicola]PTX45272.1 PEGA domain-containing protein [Christiangramia gaetbulicola]